MKNTVKVATTIIGLLIGSVAYAGSPEQAVPWGENGGGAGRAGASDLPLVIMPQIRAAAALANPLQDGADHIISQQCVTSGGFCWPHGSACCPIGPTNISAPIARGLMAAYSKTGESAHLAKAVAAGDFDLTAAFPDMSPSFGSHTPGFLHALTQLTGISGYSSFAETGFFDALTSKTYADAGVGSWTAFAPADTYDYLARHKALRGGGSINLRPWDMQYMPWVAGLIGNADSTTPADSISQQDTFLNLAVLDGLNTLVAPQTWDLIGLAGAVHGLALNGTASFPALVNPTDFPALNGVTDLCVLANLLISFQNDDGSWSWKSNLQNEPTEQDTQTTAYAVLALVAADAFCTDFSAEVSDGRDWILSLQVPGGGFLSWPGGTENVEVEGESLSALFTASACGNGVCDVGEDACNCPGDCGTSRCGDGVCCAAGGDDSCTCPEDCGTAVACDESDLASGSECGSGSRGGGEFCNAVPAVSEWGLSIMVLLGLVTGTVLFGRRRFARK